MDWRRWSVTIEQEINRAIGTELSAKGWSVKEQPTVGATRPDFVLTSPTGQVIVLEIKSPQSGVHLGAVAQVAAFKDAARESFGDSVRAMLAVPGDSAEALDQPARDFDIEVFGSSTTEPRAFASEIAARLAA